MVRVKGKLGNKNGKNWKVGKEREPALLEKMTNTWTVLGQKRNGFFWGVLFRVGQSECLGMHNTRMLSWFILHSAPFRWNKGAQKQDSISEKGWQHSISWPWYRGTDSGGRGSKPGKPRTDYGAEGCSWTSSLRFRSSPSQGWAAKNSSTSLWMAKQAPLLFGRAVGS